MKKIAFTAAAMLTAFIAFPGMAWADVDPVKWAKVTGYAEFSPENNKEETWALEYDAQCVKTEPGGKTFLLDKDVIALIVKAGSDQSAGPYVNTIFEDAKSGETVWADTNGTGAFEPDKIKGEGEVPDVDADKDISHVIVCTVKPKPSPSPTPSPTVTPTPTPTPTPVPTPSGEVIAVDIETEELAATGPSANAVGTSVIGLALLAAGSTIMYLSRKGI